MATGINNFVGLGRLTKDPELKKSSSGTSYCNFTVAISRPKNTDKSEDTADFVPCVAFGKVAETLEFYGAKGALVSVQGSLNASFYKDKEGNTKNIFNVNARVVTLHEFKKNPHKNDMEQINTGYVDPDDLPF